MRVHEAAAAAASRARAGCQKGKVGRLLQLHRKQQQQLLRMKETLIYTVEAVVDSSFPRLCQKNVSTTPVFFFLSADTMLM